MPLCPLPPAFQATAMGRATILSLRAVLVPARCVMAGWRQWCTSARNKRFPTLIIQVVSPEEIGTTSARKCWPDSGRGGLARVDACQCVLKLLGNPEWGGLAQ